MAAIALSFLAGMLLVGIILTALLAGQRLGWNQRKQYTAKRVRSYQRGERAQLQVTTQSRPMLPVSHSNNGRHSATDSESLYPLADAYESL